MSDYCGIVLPVIGRGCVVYVDRVELGEDEAVGEVVEWTLRICSTCSTTLSPWLRSLVCQLGHCPKGLCGLVPDEGLHGSNVYRWLAP